MPLTRRRFMIGGLEVAALAAAGPLATAGPLARAHRGAARGGPDERTLVVVQLTGANDGLNFVVPHRQDAYFRSRPTLALQRKDLHALDDAHGLHPAASELAQLYASGALAIVQGVGCPDPDRSHFRSMERWHSARTDGPPGDTGWLGRIADRIADGATSTMPSLHVGAEALPLALRGERWFAPSLRDPRGLEVTTLSSRHAERRTALCAAGADRGAQLAFLRSAARASYAAAERMRGLAARAGSIAYPQHELGRKLELVARLITGRFGTRLFYVTHDGYDTHARQGPAHAALLGELSTALGAFHRDLASLDCGGSVAVLVFSEFGRRVEENASKGTDHGAGAPLLIAGTSVRGGMHGRAPDLERLVDGDVPVEVDFRRVYAAIEREWLGLDGLALDRGAPVEPLTGLFA